MSGEQNIGELDAQIAGQKLNIKNAPINTLATVATLIIVCLIAYVLFTHQQDTREAGAAFVGAVKEQTTAVKEQTMALREQNCLARKIDPETCRSIAR